MNDFRPHPYQLRCIEAVENNPCVGLFLDMGLGKTVITLTAVQRLIYFRWAVARVLIIAPLTVARATWTAEAQKWSHLQGLRFSLILGSAEERREALKADADIYIINRENVEWLVNELGRGWRFDMVVVDESSSFKNPRAKRFKALKQVRRLISRVVLLTGTPAAQSLMDLWAQLYLLDEGQRLGRTLTSYRDAFFLPDKRNGAIIYSYKLRKGAEKEIYRLIGDICLSMSAEDYLQLPDIIYNTVPVELDKAAKEKYDKMERDLLLDVDDKEITAMSAASLSNKLLQMCNGACYSETGEAAEIHTCKIDALLELVEALGDAHAVICYNYRHDLERLKNALKSTKKRVSVYTGVAELGAWNAGKIDLLLVQPQSCGYGLNLQQGGNNIIWFGLTWSLELYQQTNKRLHRQGQPKPVTVHHLAVTDGMDAQVLKSLDRKESGQAALMNALKARIEELKE